MDMSPKEWVCPRATVNINRAPFTGLSCVSGNHLDISQSLKPRISLGVPCQVCQ